MFKIDTVSHPFIENLRPMDFGPINKLSFNELFQPQLNISTNSAASQFNESASNEKRFYHYKGSLTNPPCADVVNWILHKEVLPITEEHLKAFKNVWMTNLGYGNFRECQPLCGRRIVRNFEHVHDETCQHNHEHFGVDNKPNFQQLVHQPWPLHMTLRMKAWTHH